MNGISFKARARLAPLAVATLGLYWLAMFIGTHIPQPPHFVVGAADKTLHFSGYAGLAVLAASVWSLRRVLGPFNYAQIVASLSIYGAFDEISQIPVHRSCEFRDWIADVCGLIFGGVCFVLLSSVWRLAKRQNETRSTVEANADSTIVAASARD